MLTEAAPAKINLTLRVLRRRADGYHDLESLVAFARVADRLTLAPGDDGLDVTGPFADRCGDARDNLITRVVSALRAAMPGLRAGRFTLEKNLPVAAGIGGGSSDAAAALRLLARLNGLAFDDPRLMALAPHLGADVPVCIDPRPRIMRGIGDDLSPALIVPALPAVLVNPGVPLATRDVFARLVIAPDDGVRLDAPPAEGFIDYLKVHGNDLTAPALACAPVVAAVLDALAAQRGVQLTRMSGSGPTCFALFASDDDATKAAAALGSRHPGWWVAVTTLGGTVVTGCD